MRHYDIQGWFYCKGVYDLAVEKFVEGVFVEIGAWLGKSTAYLADNINDRVKLYVVDTWLGSKDPKSQQAQAATLKTNAGDIFEAFLGNMEACGVLQKLTPLCMTSLQAARLFEDESVSFCFIDGSHDYDSVKADLMAWYPKVRQGGIIAGDDYCADWPQVDKAVNEFFNGEQEKVCERCWLVTK